MPRSGRTKHQPPSADATLALGSCMLTSSQYPILQTPLMLDVKPFMSVLSYSFPVLKLQKENTKLYGSLAPYRKWTSSLPIPNPTEVYGAQLFTSCYSGAYLLNNTHVWWIGEAVCLQFDQEVYRCCIALY